MSRYKQEEKGTDSDLTMYVLKDVSKNRVWHEQFYSWRAAKECIDSYKEKGIEGNWEIDTIYPKN